MSPTFPLPWFSKAAWKAKFQRPRYWVWSAILLSAVIFATVTWLHVHETRILRQTAENFATVRQARVDLAKGFMHICLADSPGAPFDSTDGEALLKQAVLSFDEALSRMADADPGMSRDFQKKISAFLGRLDARKEKSFSQQQIITLRVSFNELERQAEELDRHMRDHLRKHADLLALQFGVALGMATLLLIIICGVVIHAGRTSDRFESASHESAERLRLAMEATRDGVWDLDVKTGSVYYSPGYWRMLGYRDEDRDGVIESWAELLHPDDREATLALNQACFENRSDTLETEFRLRAKNGSWRWVLSRGRVITRDETGAALRMVGTHVDITEHKRSEEALRASEEQFRAIFQVVSVGIVQVVPQSGQILRFNEKYCEITGYPADELLALKFTELTHPDDRQQDWAIFDRAVKSRASCYNNEKRYVRKDGSVIWVRLNATFIRDGTGTPIRSVAVCEDITARKQAEAERENLQSQLIQAQKMESVGRLAGRGGARLQQHPHQRDHGLHATRLGGNGCVQPALQRAGTGAKGFCPRGGAYPPVARVRPAADHRPGGSRPERDRCGHAQDASPADRGRP